MARSEEIVPGAVGRKANPNACPDPRHTPWAEKVVPKRPAVKEGRIPIQKEQARPRMSRPNRSRKNHKKPHHKEHSTFDPKLHHRSHGSSGYGMKRDHVQTEEETSGKQLAHILGIK